MDRVDFGVRLGEWRGGGGEAGFTPGLLLGSLLRPPFQPLAVVLCFSHTGVIMGGEKVTNCNHLEVC